MNFYTCNLLFFELRMGLFLTLLNDSLALPLYHQSSCYSTPSLSPALDLLATAPGARIAEFGRLYCREVVFVHNTVYCIIMQFY